MKKTLIALAAVAVAGAASAQVTVSGGFTWGYANTESNGVTAAGFGFDEAVVTFATSEDLGGGLKLAASQSIRALGKTATALGQGTSISISGGMGTVAMTTVESSDYLPLDVITITANGTTGDRLSYTSPNFSGFTVGVVHNDGSGAGVGYGARTSAGANTAFAVNYKQGPLAVNATRVEFEREATSAVVGNTNSRNMAKISYDFGIAQVTAGVIAADLKGAANDRTEKGLSVSMPVNGALTVGVDVAQAKVDTQKALNAFALNASYSLSKRTNVGFVTKSWDVANQAKKNNATEVTLNHSF